MNNLSNQRLQIDGPAQDQFASLSVVSSRPTDENSKMERIQKEVVKLEMKFQGQHAFMLDVLKCLDNLDRCDDFNELKSCLYKIRKRINSELNIEERWESLDQHLSLVQSDFYKSLKNRFDCLTHVDLEMCAYLRMNMNTKDISRHLNLSVRGVETRKYRLKKKFSLGKTGDLEDFIASL